MIPSAGPLDQPVLTYLRDHDPLVQRYRAFFALLDWTQVPERATCAPWPGPTPHPVAAYIKSLLVTLCEQHEYCTHLRLFTLEHPLFTLELAFRPVLDSTHLYGFDLDTNVHGAHWRRHKQRPLAP